MFIKEVRRFSARNLPHNHFIANLKRNNTGLASKILSNLVQHEPGITKY